LTTPAALSNLAEILDAASIRWALMGALAANRYRLAPRLTNDIDLLLADSGGSLDELEQALESAGWSVVRADPGGELLRLTHETYGMADLLIAGTEYQQQALQRATEEPVGDIAIKILTIEDVIVHKLIAGRYQDLADIEAILASSPEMDREYIRSWATFWDVLERWENL
jgi:predicted nucleotidyltransferase